ncbi:hypothetical protein ISN45_Aa02g015400 [Arabidopsis thaliana x Arabidopsis arenosa]|uniref:Uncharacterized protein n=1 Tax=Arabidopsis thaliana x Arabidopsis arenosa TaxID=1240361 RepID=A0A8T2BFZ0_9BRAS|nr:hypothetical protein ISN45_Aa03g032740 [Arabidopsis thaliana x Arabidopsis arenosa]KAG7579109.1 hypothetical protein ISN45_Aa03g032740 [Arabidopsis thaliana x Arabidopsis arenosa]KAG7586217.1 hypothetical protein ISN45_Aa02g015400 [Arabidopsis thaliana x Arabidopsis arenosa]KAG7586218.1 hypothetical protein ISN45_Aa02g015400 [Arabidopsis thaliana x Arabidopsis arenosa]
MHCCVLPLEKPNHTSIQGSSMVPYGNLAKIYKDPCVHRFIRTTSQGYYMGPWSRLLFPNR